MRLVSLAGVAMAGAAMARAEAGGRVTTGGAACVFPVVVEGQVREDCFAFQGEMGEHGMCFDGTRVAACAAPTVAAAPADRAETTPEPAAAPEWRVLPPSAPPVFRPRQERQARRSAEEQARDARFGGPLTNGTKRPGCKQWQPPSGFNSIREFCNHMLTVPLTVLDRTYANGYPLSGETPKGCYVGCPVGASPQTLEAITQPWYGKCFWPEEGIVTNVIQHPVLGDMHAFKGDVSVGRSWSVPFGGRATDAWIIDYSDTPVRIMTGLRDFSQFRDEFRFVEPGMILGKMYALPYTQRNPTPIRMFTAVFFALFDVCTESPSLEEAGTPELVRNLQQIAV